MKLCDVCDKFWAWLLSESYVSLKVSEWGCGSSKRVMINSVLDI